VASALKQSRTASSSSSSDYDTKQPMPARVIFRPPPGAGFADSLVSGHPGMSGGNAEKGAIVAPGVVGSVEGVMLQTGVANVPVPAGKYDVFINRGPEWEAVEATVSVAAGKTQPVHVTLEHSVDTRGWLAADMHVHMETSFDSNVPQDRRVISMASSGIEVMVTTDHHHVVDVLPLVRALGYGPSPIRRPSPLAARPHIRPTTEGRGAAIGRGWVPTVTPTSMRSRSCTRSIPMRS
jgi:hypothetical protein